MELNKVEVFLQVARLKSFAEAARHLGVTGPAASKQVMALEEELGVKLLHRTTRSVTLTDEGHVFFERARHAMDELAEATEAVRDLKATPKGLLKVNAPLSFAHMHLLPVLSGFAKKYPEVVMDVSLDDRTVDVQAEGYDVVLRIIVIHDSSLMVRKLAMCPIIPVASPNYIKEHGLPRTPQALKQHRLIAYSYMGGSVEWKFRDVKGKTGSIKQEAAFRANTAELMLQAALDGVGIAMLPHFSAATHVKAKQLVRILPGFESWPEREIVALMPPNRYRSTKVKLFIDYLSAAIKAIPCSE